MRKNSVQPNLTSVYKKLIDHDEDLLVIRREMVTKSQFDQTVDTLDKIFLIVTRMNQEHVFTTEWVRRIVRDVERLKRRLQVA